MSLLGFRSYMSYRALRFEINSLRPTIDCIVVAFRVKTLEVWNVAYFSCWHLNIRVCDVMCRIIEVVSKMGVFKLIDRWELHLTRSLIRKILVSLKIVPCDVQIHWTFRAGVWYLSPAGGWWPYGLVHLAAISLRSIDATTIWLFLHLWKWFTWSSVSCPVNCFGNFPWRHRCWVSRWFTV